MHTKKRNVRDERGQLLTLLNGWDPAGVVQAGGPRHEYDQLVEPLLQLLSQDATREEVAAFLEREISTTFGKAPRDATQFAAKVVTWYEMLASE
jgi:hypothetical protein